MDVLRIWQKLDPRKQVVKEGGLTLDYLLTLFSLRDGASTSGFVCWQDSCSNSDRNRERERERERRERKRFSFSVGMRSLQFCQICRSYLSLHVTGK